MDGTNSPTGPWTSLDHAHLVASSHRLLAEDAVLLAAQYPSQQVHVLLQPPVLSSLVLQHAPRTQSKHPPLGGKQQPKWVAIGFLLDAESEQNLLTLKEERITEMQRKMAPAA